MPTSIARTLPFAKWLFLKELSDLNPTGTWLSAALSVEMHRCGIKNLGLRYEFGLLNY
jgi:hypothetical protein